MLLGVAAFGWDKVGGGTWATSCAGGKLARQVFSDCCRNVAGRRTPGMRFSPVQPDWWQGDSQYHAPKYEKPASELERRLKAGEFVVTAEVAPPISAKIDKMVKNIDTIKPYVAAVNFTDNPSAAPRTASWACSVLSLKQGAEPVMQIAPGTGHASACNPMMGAVDLGSATSCASRATA
jgi:hypothetical protein